MASVASQLIVEVTAHAKSDSLEDAREICADGTYLPNNLRSFGLSTPLWDTQTYNIPSNTKQLYCMVFDILYLGLLPFTSYIKS